MRGTYALPQRHHHPRLGTVLFIVGIVISLIVIGIAISGAFKLPSFNFQPPAAVPVETQKEETTKESVSETEVSQIDVLNTAETEVREPIETQTEETMTESTETSSPTETQPMVNETASDTPQQDVPTEETVVMPKDNFIVEPELWEKAFIVHRIDGSIFPGVGYAGLSINDEIFAPISGYAHLYEMGNSEGGIDYTITISTSDTWEMGSPNNSKDDRVIFIVSRGFDPLLSFPCRVVAGQEIAKLSSIDLLPNNHLKEKMSLVVMPDVDWGKMIDVSPNSPMEYMTCFLSLLSDQKNSGGGK